MSPADMAEIHAASMRHGRAWSAAEIAALGSAPGAIKITLPHTFALGRVTLDEAELLTIAVALDAQGNGIGTDCLHRFHEAASAAGATRVFLEVAEDNVPARALYARAGYTQVGRRAGYYRTGDAPAVDALILRLELRR